MTGQAVKPLPSFFAEPERAEFLSLRAANAALREPLDPMRSLAFRDQLTGLFSRHYLTDYLEERIREDSNETNIVLALCDIDDFKTINDARGHQSGDIAIVCIADILDEARNNPDIPSFELIVRAGRITDTLAEQMIEPFGPDLVVCGERGLSNIKYAFVGSISTFLIRNVRCDVLVVKQN